MHLALLHDGRPALLRVEGPAGAPVALFFHLFPLHSDAWEEMLSAYPPPGARRRLEDLASRASSQGIADALRGMAMRPDSVPDLATWNVPTLVIAGENDQLMPFTELETLAYRIPRAKLEVISG